MKTGIRESLFYRDSIDDFAGVVHLRDLVKHQDDESMDLETLCRPITFFNEKTKLFKAMAILHGNCQHLAIVRDEFGITQGLVTLEDMIEETP